MKANRILCINDNQINLLILKKQIQLSGIAEEVICLNDGYEGLEFFKDLKNNPGKPYPNLIFLDIHMPRVDGWDFLDRFSEEYLAYFPDTKVIVFSYSLDDSERTRIEPYECVIDFLNVPLTVKYLHNLQEELVAEG